MDKKRYQNVSLSLARSGGCLKIPSDEQPLSLQPCLYRQHLTVECKLTSRTTISKQTKKEDTLRKRFDRPRLIHQAHVRAILCAPALKTGSGKELRRLHDTLVQHLRALKAMKSEPAGSFVTSMIELQFGVRPNRLNHSLILHVYKKYIPKLSSYTLPLVS